MRFFNRFLEIFFSGHCWARRYLGGKWELLYVDPCMRYIWHAVDRFSIKGKDKAPVPCLDIGPADQEDWGEEHRVGIDPIRYDKELLK